MNIECSHCGAMNPTESTFCGECGWQIVPPDVEVEIERFIATIQKKAGPDTVKARPEVRPAGGEAKLDPEQATISTEMETGQVNPKTVPEEGPAGSEAEPAAITAEPEAGQADLKTVPELEPSGNEAELEPEPVVISLEPEAGQADLEVLSEEAPAEGEVELEAEPFVGGAGPGSRPATVDARPDGVYEATSVAFSSREVVFFEDGEGVTITSSAAVFGDRTYAWPNIVSVAVETHRPSRWPSLLLAAFGAALLALAVVSLGRDSRLGLVLIAGGLALLAIGATFGHHGPRPALCVRADGIRRGGRPGFRRPGSRPKDRTGHARRSNRAGSGPGRLIQPKSVCLYRQQRRRQMQNEGGHANDGRTTKRRRCPRLCRITD